MRQQSLILHVIALVLLVFIFTQFLLRESEGQTTPKYSLSDVTKPQEKNQYGVLGRVFVTNEGHMYFETDYELGKIDAVSKKMTFIEAPFDCSFYVNTNTGIVYCFDDTSISIINEKEEGEYTLIVGIFDESGYSGDGDDARKALFDGISSMYIDKEGIIYIVDGNNNALRKVDENGIVTTMFTTSLEIIDVYVDDNGVVFFFKKFRSATAISYKRLCKWTVENGEEILVDNLEENSERGLLGWENNLLYVESRPLSSTLRIYDLRTGNITRFAGNDKQASFDAVTFGDGGKSSDAYFIALSNFCIHDGFLYLSDFGLKTIRKISMIDGTISLILFINSYGTIIGPFIDGFNSNETTLHSPKQLFLDNQSGNLYVSDYGAVRKLSTNNKLEMIVPKKELNFDVYDPFTLNPVSVSTNNSDLYVVSSKGFLHKFNGSVSTMIAGPMTASRLFQQHKDQLVLNSPKGLFATTNFLYVVDSNNHRVIRIHRTTGMVFGVAGCGNAGFSGDGGLATLATLNSPTGIYLDNDMLYIADTKNHRIRTVNITTGIIRTLAGTGVQGYNGDNIIALSAHLNTPTYLHVNYEELFFSDSFNNRIRQITLNTGIIKTYVGSGIKGFNGAGSHLSIHLDTPMGLSVCSDVLYFADTGNNLIRYVDFNQAFGSAIVLTHSGDATEGGSTEDINLPNVIYNTPTCVYCKDFFWPTLVVTDSLSHKIRLDFIASSYTVVGNGMQGFNYFEGNTTGSNVKLNTPQCAIYDGANSVFFISDSGNNRILESKGNEQHVVKKFAGGIGDNNLVLYAHVEASHVAFSSSGEMFISETDRNRIRKVATNGIITTIAGTGVFGSSEDGKLASSSNIASPKGLYVNEEGELIFVESGISKIRKINKMGLLETVAGDGTSGFSQTLNPKTSSLNSPSSVVSFKGQTIISDTNNNVIRKISTITGHPFDIIAGDGSAPSQTESKPLSISPTSMTINSEGNVVLNNIRKLEAYCDNGYVYSKNDSCLPICYGKIKLLNDSVCYNNGECLSPDMCQCFDSSRYTGFQCEIPVCYGEAANSSTVCTHGRGNCTAPNTCVCQDGYTSSICQTAICYSKILEDACGGSARGTCSDRNQCTCNSGYTGLECELLTCFGMTEKEEDVCSGRGSCLSPNRCTCQFGYSGEQCQHSDELWALIGALIGVAVLVFFVGGSLFIIFGLFRKYYVQRKIIKTDKLVTDNILELEFDNDGKKKEEEDSFFISINKLDLGKMKKLGSGGYGSVFQSKWAGTEVAIKVFDLNNMNIDENDFRSEATVLSRLRHPNIISFFGVSSTPTKRYIVMEKMERSLENIIAELQSNRMKLTLTQKMDMMIDICKGIEYLHNLKPTIVHRDLKPANILQDIHGVGKLYDFGLSRLLNKQNNTQITNQIGTFYYMR